MIYRDFFFVCFFLSLLNIKVIGQSDVDFSEQTQESHFSRTHTRNRLIINLFQYQWFRHKASILCINQRPEQQHPEIESMMMMTRTLNHSDNNRWFHVYFFLLLQNDNDRTFSLISIWRAHENHIHVTPQYSIVVHVRSVVSLRGAAFPINIIIADFFDANVNLVYILIFSPLLFSLSFSILSSNVMSALAQSLSIFNSTLHAWKQINVAH